MSQKAQVITQFPQHLEISKSETNGGFLATSTSRLTLSLAPDPSQNNGQYFPLKIT
ncbi:MULTISPECIES: hypothetical protein [Acinetobacter calcoaceticus/baumannii complex]|uniref:hypothetical protein n=1 Tax=Acinetobacter calcoaceticus/baumannii complex TaxID=909768 RepID=UPI0012D7B061|nr:MULTISPECIES: hypothetical protein [Acinetobacter calcoaceticus/baumannii complex]MBW8293158.1 hypothetical protein [Acinetobacter pittii]